MLDDLNSSYPDINDDGWVAYLGNFAGGRGVFMDDMLLAATGDVIDGETLIDVGAPSINNHGDVAFLATFSGGRTGIVLALVPEPSSAMLIGAVALCLYEHRRWRSRRS